MHLNMLEEEASWYLVQMFCFGDAFRRQASLTSVTQLESVNLDTLYCVRFCLPIVKKNKLYDEITRG